MESGISDSSKIIGRIHSIETGGTVDGPGIRYIVFFQGCQFKCIYCHNRDTWDFKSGKEVTVDELMSEIKSYAPFFRSSGGGVTASGGEASLQPKFVYELFRRVHEAGFNTCLDTNGGIHNFGEDTLKLINETDVFLLDIKAMDDEVHMRLTKRSNKDTLAFARYLKEHNKKMWIRLVVVPEYTDSEENARAMGELIKELGDSVERVELLPYHELGKHKWKFFNEEYELENIHPPKKEVMDKLKGIIKEYHHEVY
ncbi:MAG: pyruvate formate-lyase-activating protein [Succinivibrionaceae bacterium]